MNVVVVYRFLFLFTSIEVIVWIRCFTMCISYGETDLVNDIGIHVGIAVRYI
jgi:hypothetical protein